jgi:hypothetical protein
LRDALVGVLELSTPAAESFQCGNDWLADAEALPYVALYRNGLRVESFAAFQARALLARLERLAFLPGPAAAITTPAFAAPRATAA